MIYCKKKNMNRLKIGGIDSILAYIVVSIPLIYILVFMIGTLYHYAVQSYISQSVKETITNASAYGELTSKMLLSGEDPSNLKRGDGLHNRLYRITGDPNINYTLVVKRYNDTATALIDVWDGKYDTDNVKINDLKSVLDTVNTLDKDSQYRFRKGDIIALQIESEDNSLLGSISNFGLFGPDGTVDMHYSGYREDIIRNEGTDGW